MAEGRDYVVKSVQNKKIMNSAWSQTAWREFLSHHLLIYKQVNHANSLILSFFIYVMEMLIFILFNIRL